MDDLEFVQRCVKGDRDAWDEFIGKYSRLIYNYIHSVLNLSAAHRFNQEDKSELFQEIFCLLTKDNFKKLKSFKARNGCSLASWLRQVVINFTLDYLRKSKPAVSLDEETEDEIGLKNRIADSSALVSDILEDNEKAINLKECIEKLDTDEKYFLELHINRNLNFEELQGVFGFSRPAMDMRKSRIIGRLRDCFKVKGFSLDF